MPITNPNPVSVPAVEAKTYPHLWLYNTIVHAPSTTSGRILIETLPYNADTQEIGSGSDMVAISTDQLWKAVSEVPEVAAAMQAILAAVVPLRTWIDTQAATPEVAPEPTPQEVVVEEATPIETPVETTETL